MDSANSLSVRKLNKRTYWFPDNLPVISERGKIIKYGNEIGYQGSIISVLPNKSPLYHFGLILGYDNKNRLWILDNTTAGILVTDYREFTNFSKNEFSITLLQDKTQSNIIMQRAVDFYKNRKYFSNTKNNCEMFVDYCYGQIDIPESFQVKLIKFIAKRLLNLSIDIYINSTDDKVKIKGLTDSKEGVNKALDDF